MILATIFLSGCERSNNTLLYLTKDMSAPFGPWTANKTVREGMAKIPQGSVREIQIGHLGNVFGPNGTPLQTKDPKTVAELENELRNAELFKQPIEEDEDHVILFNAQGQEIVRFPMEAEHADMVFGRHWQKTIVKIREQCAEDLKQQLTVHPLAAGSIAVVRLYSGYLVPNSPSPFALRLPSGRKPQLSKLVLTNPTDVASLYSLLTSGNRALYGFDENSCAGFTVDIGTPGHFQTVHLLLNLAWSPGRKWVLKDLPNEPKQTSHVLHKMDSLVD